MATPFANNIKDYRTKMYRTQCQMADLLNVSQSTYNNWEQGKNEPSMKNIRKIAQNLGVSEDELLKSGSIIKIVNNQDNSINASEVHDLLKKYIDTLKDTITALKQAITAQKATMTALQASNQVKL
jgi:transcriptional regulator with XRE-family HTH domain